MRGLGALLAAMIVVAAPAVAAAQDERTSLDVSVVEDSADDLVLLVGAPDLAGLTIPEDAFEVRVDGDVRPSVARPVRGSELRVVLVIDNAGVDQTDEIRDLQLAAVDLLLRLPEGATAAVVATDGRVSPPSAQRVDAVRTVRELGRPQAVGDDDTVARAVDFLAAGASDVPPTLVVLTTRPSLVDQLDLGATGSRVRALVPDPDDAEALPGDADALARELSSLHVIDVEPGQSPGESVDVLLRRSETVAAGTAGSTDGDDDDDDDDVIPIAAAVASLSMAAVLWAIDSRSDDDTHVAVARGARLLLIATLFAFAVGVGVAAVGLLD